MAVSVLSSAVEKSASTLRVSGSIPVPSVSGTFSISMSSSWRVFSSVTTVSVFCQFQCRNLPSNFSKSMVSMVTIDRLQEKASDLRRLERHFGREQVQSIVERSKALEQAERVTKRPKRAFEMSR